jgi:hypothetical protein
MAFTKKSYDEFESKMRVVSRRGKGVTMSGDSPALFASETMPRRRASSHQAPGPQTVAKMKARQSARIREIAEVLVEGGLVTLDAQADALGLCRSTAWTILKSSHKSSGLSAKVISRILAEPQLPERVRTTLHKYVEEKASGRYGQRKNAVNLSPPFRANGWSSRRKHEVSAAAAATDARPAIWQILWVR